MIFHLHRERETPEGAVQYRIMAERHDGTGRMALWAHDNLDSAERALRNDTRRVHYWIEEWTFINGAWTLTDSDPRTGKGKG